jgi:hypothetical protein
MCLYEFQRKTKPTRGTPREIDGPVIRFANMSVVLSMGERDT